MLKPTATSLTVLALTLTLGGGLPLLADAQQTQAPPPVKSAAPSADQPPSVYRTPSQPQPEEEEEEDAPETAQDSAPPPAAGSVKINTSETGIRYTSGGVGEGERQELRAISEQFNLRIMSAMQGGGEYVADAQVTILDAHGAAVLSATSKGPYFLAQLSPGAYTVELSVGGQKQKQSAQVAKGQTQLSFYWR